MWGAICFCCAYSYQIILKHIKKGVAQEKIFLFDNPHIYSIHLFRSVKSCFEKQAEHKIFLALMSHLHWNIGRMHWSLSEPEVLSSCPLFGFEFQKNLYHFMLSKRWMISKNNRWAQLIGFYDFFNRILKIIENLSGSKFLRITDHVYSAHKSFHEI